MMQAGQQRLQQQASQYNGGVTGGRQCSFCRGTGKSPTKKYPPNYTGSTTVSHCSDCGETTRSHWHDLCPSCRGRGTR